MWFCFVGLELRQVGTRAQWIFYSLYVSGEVMEDWYEDCSESVEVVSRGLEK